VSEAVAIDDIAALKEGIAPVRDRLTTTLFLVAIFHGIVILGITFTAPLLPKSDSAPSLEVLLVQNPVADSELNLSADYLAQVNQQGAGTDPAMRGAESPLSTPPPADQGSETGQGASATTSERPPGAPDLVATRAATPDSRYFSSAAAAAAGAPATPDVVSDAPPVDADAGRQLRLKGQAQRELFITPNTRESSVSVYLDTWKRKIERIGSLNYPLDAVRRRGMSGNPVLEVQILANGTLGEVLVRRTSGYAELDQAALGILRLAAPFAPFPGELAARHDALRFAYEWQFSSGTLIDSTVRMPADTR
jgi:protein TonB